MARAATTSDAFNAVAEPRRRAILDILGRGTGQTVNELVEELGIAQPAMSKHLGVLRKVGLVTVSKQGQHRSYSLSAEKLQVVHDWVKTFDRFWTSHLAQIKQAAERKAQQREQLKRSDRDPHNN